MKKILLVGINAKYIHSNLAIRCLKAYAEQNGVASPISLQEYTINQNPSEILEGIISQNPDIVGFSCYIFNIETTLRLVQDLKAVLPGCVIFLGGPEAGTRSLDLMEKYNEIDFIIRGEGERPTALLLHTLEENNSSFSDLPSLSYRLEDDLIETQLSEPLHHESLPYRYTKDEIEALEHKIIYFESSRGCPFRCSYCLSSVDKHLRFFPMSEVLDQLKLFLDCRVQQVKFIDRTFNCDRERALAIWRFLKENDNGVTNFHFEIAAELLSHELMELLKEMRPGLIQLEIGVQSTNPETLTAIHRKADWNTAKEKIARIIAKENVHIHLDLIAGLPKEGFSSFTRSFDDVYALQPHQLQLGFLKLLAGSLLESEADHYGIVCRKYPPYEVLRTTDLSFDELAFLKQVEVLVDFFYNSGRFRSSLALLEPFFETPFSFYSGLKNCLAREKITVHQLGKYGGYKLLLKFCESREPSLLPALRQAVKYDIFARERVQVLPPFLGLSITRQNSDKVRGLASAHLTGKSPKEYQVEYFNGNSVIPEGYTCFFYGKRDLYGNAETKLLYGSCERER